MRTWQILHKGHGVLGSRVSCCLISVLSLYQAWSKSHLAELSIPKIVHWSIQGMTLFLSSMSKAQGFVCLLTAVSAH